jgi:hypothetical protein
MKHLYYLKYKNSREFNTNGSFIQNLQVPKSLHILHLFELKSTIPFIGQLTNLTAEYILNSSNLYMANNLCVINIGSTSFEVFKNIIKDIDTLNNDVRINFKHRYPTPEMIAIMS